MKKLMVIYVVLMSVLSGWGQSYVRLADAGGVDINPYLSQLTQASDELKGAFSTSLQDEFKVFDTGYYIHNNVMDGANEVDNLWQKSINQIKETHPEISTYILFGRVNYVDGTIITKVKVVLPEEDIFYCIDNISSGFRAEIEKLVYSKANALNETSTVFPNEVNAIKALQYIIENKICCDPEGAGLRNSQSCSSCMVLEEDILIRNDKKYYPSFSEFEKLVDDGFVIDAVGIVSDTEYYITGDENDQPSARQTRGGARTLVLPINATINLENDGTHTVSALLDDILASAPDLEVFEYKYPRDCGKYEELMSAFNSAGGDAIFIVLINIDRENGVLAYKLKSGSNASRSGQRGVFGQGNPTEDDLEGMQEARADAGGSCFNLIVAHGERFEYNNSLVLAKIIFSREEFEKYQKYYEERSQRTRNNVTEASLEYGYYFEMEYHIQKKKYDRWDWTAKVVSHYNMCAEVIHGILDFCGMVEPILCNGTSALIYTFKGDKLNASLSAAAVIPVGKPFKLAGTFVKTAGSATGVVYKVVLKPGLNVIHWVGGRGKLARVMAKAGGTCALCKLTDPLNNSVREIHHLIPWKFTDYKNVANFRNDLNKKLAAAGWHPSDPLMNGFDIPKYLRDGSTFHGSHEAYSNWIEDALIKINDSGATGTLLKQKMDDLAVFLRSEITKAYGNGIPKATTGGTGKSLHEHFSPPFPAY